MKKNNIRQLRKQRKWTQQELADRINSILEIHPQLKKVTKRNPEGTTDQKSIQTLETGKTSLNDRWLTIFSSVFGVETNELLGTSENIKYNPNVTKEASLQKLIKTAKKDYENDPLVNPLLKSLEAAGKHRKNRKDN